MEIPPLQFAGHYYRSKNELVNRVADIVGAKARTKISGQTSNILAADTGAESSELPGLMGNREWWKTIVHMPGHARQSRVRTKFKRSAICLGVSVVRSGRPWLFSSSRLRKAACTAPSIGTLVKIDSPSKDTMISLSCIY